MRPAPALTIVLGGLLAACNAPADRAGRAGHPRISRPNAVADHVLLVTIDGLIPEVYLAPDKHGLAVPALRRIAAEGAAAEGARSVFASVTYPAHTTLMTGVLPARHGITTNRPPDPLGANQGGWRWYAEDIRARTLWQAAGEAGLSTALVSWP